ncbi:MAG: putative signal transducing protein [Terriglobales bacterium]
MSTQPLPDNRDLVVVFNSMDESEVLVVKSLLEGEGIECLMTGEVPQNILPGVGGWVIQVPPDQADDARQLIESEREGALSAGDAELTDETDES